MIPGLLLNRSAHTTGLRNLQTTCPGPRASWRPVRFFQCDAMTRPGGRRKGGGLPFGFQLLLVHLSSNGGHLRLPPPASSGRPAPSGTQRLPRPSQDRLCRAPAPSHCGFDDVTSPSSSPQTREHGRQPRRQHQSSPPLVFTVSGHPCFQLSNLLRTTCTTTLLAGHAQG